MKKISVILGNIIIFLFIYFLQSNFFNWFNIAGIKPNLFIIFVICIGLFIGKGTGLMLGLLFGILLDFFAGKAIGVYGIVLGLIGYVSGYLDKKFSKESKITIIFICFILTIVYEAGIYIVNVFGFGSVMSASFFAKTVLIEAIFNILILIILYPILKKLGYFVQDIFKGNNILTRYF